MSEKLIKVGARVELTGKDLKGTVAYMGMIKFAVGKWVGVELDEPKGKNNGTVKGETYFVCGENHGMFVRPTQVRVLAPAPDSARRSTEDVAETASVSSTGSVRSHATPQPTKARLSGSRTSLSSSRQSLLGSRSQLATSLTERSPSSVSVSSAAGSATITGRKSLLPSALSANAARDISASNISIPTSEGGNNGNGGAIGGGGSSHASSKRASFVETGFLEILKPQFTPSQPIRSPSFTAPLTMTTTTGLTMTAEEKAAAAEQRKLIEELRTENADLNEKLETLKQRRAEDKERLREFDKMKIQFEQMQEFRTKIMAAQASLQRELQRAKQEAKDAIEAREQHAQEMADLNESIEMLTIDKEMAEEKVETLQLELDITKERVEELQVDLELLRSEMQNKIESAIEGKLNIGDGNSGGGVNIGGGIGTGVSSFEFKQLEQQNARLKETLVRLRDLSAHDKHDIQKLTKELEMKKSEVNELERTKEKLSAKVDELESTIVDLQEQVDAALGAEEMVEQLAEKKLELEDRVKLLEEEVEELEALEEVHEQLVESNRELEMDLREELDLANAAKKDIMRERDAAIETIYDRDQTISKFRELVQKLNEQLLELRERNVAAAAAAVLSGNEPKSLHDANDKANTETIDYKQIFAESKAYTRAIDVQLRQIELSQANEHVQMLTAFMPESFMARGGDHDAILVILLISRIIFKCGIVVSQTRERFPAVEQLTRETVIQGHAAQQYAFKCRLMHYIHNLQCALHQIIYGLTSCSPDTLLRAGSSLPEMVAQEKTIDGIIELLKSNQLDENSSTEHMEKCLAFFNAMNSVLFAGEELVNETQMIRDCVASLSSACESILNDVSTVRAIIRESSSTGGASDATLLMQYLGENTESIKQQVKLIKRRLPQDLHISKVGMSPHKLKGMRQITLALSRIMSAMHVAAKQAVQTIVASIENDNTAEHAIDHAKFWDLLAQACERVYEQDDRGPAINFKGVLGQANIDLQQMAQYLLDKEYEIMSSANQQKQEKPVLPIILRAQTIKKQLEQKNVLAATLENREADIKQLKLAAKLKQNELSEMQIRKDLAEKKLSVLQSEHEHAEKWKSQYEEVFELLKRKEKEYEETMDHLQADINQLEDERMALRERLKASGVSLTGAAAITSKRGSSAHSTSISSNDTSASANTTNMTNVSTTSAGGGSQTSGSASGLSGHGTAAMPVHAEELQLLKHLLNNERNTRLQLQAEQMRERMRRLEPIRVPQPRDKRITELEGELTKMKHAWALSLLRATQPSRDTTKLAYVVGEANRGDAKTAALATRIDNIALQRCKQPIPNKTEISERASALAAEILAEYLRRNPHRAAQYDCSFASFPSVEVKRLLKA